MPNYHRLGEIPPKRHTQFRKADGTLYSEEVFGTEGFSGNYSILYYYYPPTRVKKIEKFRPQQFIPEVWDEGLQRHHHLKTGQLASRGDAVSGRQALMFNKDVELSVAKPTTAMNYFYRDGDSDLVYMLPTANAISVVHKNWLRILSRVNTRYASKLAQPLPATGTTSIPSTSWVGTATNIPGSSTLATSNPSPDACTSRLPYTRPSRDPTSWSARLCRVS